MSYTESGITVLEVVRYDGGVMLRVANTNADKLLQCYVNGSLAAWQSAAADRWTVTLPTADPCDTLFLLAVDAADARRNYFSDAFPDATANRLRVRMAETIAPFRPGDRWRVYRGDAGDGEATILAHDRLIRRGGRGVGVGYHFGYGGFGFDGFAAKGFGYNFGYGEFGFDCEMLEWTSKPLPPGTYPVKSSIVDAAGNESTAATDTITLTAYARPAQSLSVSSYTKGTDTLVLSFTESEDIT